VSDQKTSHEDYEPPYLFPDYRSTELRAPKHRPVRLPNDWFHVAEGPVFGRIPVRAEDADLTRQHAGEPLGERIVLSGRVIDSDGRAVRNTLVGLPLDLPAINIARGRLIDEAALRRALESGWIAGAVLDVFNDEPLPPDSPLYGIPNLVITPHTSWSSDQVTERGIVLFTENLRRYLAGEPLENVVDLEAGY